MKTTSILCLVVVLGAAGAAFAGPSLPVTKPPLGPVPSWTGPVVDPHAVMGQWFRDRYTPLETVRSHEFHDNLPGFGGGFAGSSAILGVVSALAFDPAGGGIAGFDITATITNDGGPEGPWEEGTNSHGEYVAYPPRQPYRGTFYDVKLTTSFADDGLLSNWPGPVGPYSGSELGANIYAVNHDELAWYCWTPENPNPDLAPWGDYMVPTWDFGAIPLGGSASRLLSFGLYAPVGPGSVLWSLLTFAHQSQADLFLNRTTSLKISDYFDALSLDPGTPYPLPPSLSSDVSVFHSIPEPGTLVLALLGAGFIARRR